MDQIQQGSDAVISENPDICYTESAVDGQGHEIAGIAQPGLYLAEHGETLAPYCPGVLVRRPGVDKKKAIRLKQPAGLVEEPGDIEMMHGIKGGDKAPHITGQRHTLGIGAERRDPRGADGQHVEHLLAGIHAGNRVLWP